MSTAQGGAYPGAFVLSDDGSQHNPFAAMVVPLPPQLSVRTIPRRLTRAEAITHRREYCGCGGADGVTDELLRYCVKLVTESRARVSWILWADGCACLLIRPCVPMQMTDAHFVRCYVSARATAEVFYDAMKATKRQ